MSNIRKLLPEGVLPSRKKLKEMSKEMNTAEKAYETRQDEYYRGSGKVRKVTEASWKETVKLIYSAVSNKNKTKLAPEKILDVLKFYGFHIARMISYSKSAYREKNPHDVIFFNANLIDKKIGKIWHGDLNLTNDAKNLIEAAKELNTTFYVLSEMDGRFNNENKKVKELIKVAKWNTNQNVPVYDKDWEIVS